MAEHQEIRAGIFVSAFTSWRDATAGVLRASGNPGLFMRAISSILMPSWYDPIDDLPRITDRTILIIHGTDDAVVPFAHGERLYEVCRMVNPQVKFRSVQGGDHNSLRWIDSSLDGEMTEFFRIAARE